MRNVPLKEHRINLGRVVVDQADVLRKVLEMALRIYSNREVLSWVDWWLKRVVEVPLRYFIYFRAEDDLGCLTLPV